MRISFLFVILSLASYAQENKIATLRLDALYHAGINPAGELYTASSNKVSRYDKEGKLMTEHALATAAGITQFDAWHLTQLVLYYRETQRVEIYNPDLEIRNSFVIDSVFAIEPQWIAASFDQKNFWIYDGADESIKKVNYKTGEVLVDEVNTVFSSTTEKILSMREYQRFLFIQTTSKLFIFNAMGKHIRTLPTEKQAFDFFGEEITLLQGTSLHFSSLFTKDERTKALPGLFQKVWLSDERLFAVKANTIEIFSFDPQ
jgi:hypothetical protein